MGTFCTILCLWQELQAFWYDFWP